MNLIDYELVSKNFATRDVYAHKGNFGTTLMIVGSYSMAGAATLLANPVIGTIRPALNFITHLSKSKNAVRKQAETIKTSSTIDTASFVFKL